MPGASVRISGFEDVRRNLASARRDIGGACMKALESAISVIENEVYIRTPVGITEEGKPHLKNSIIHMLTADANFRWVAGAVGFGNEGYRAAFVEYGHKLVGHKPGKKPLGHVPAHPFLRPAFDACKERATEAFVATLGRELKAIYG